MLTDRKIALVFKMLSDREKTGRELGVNFVKQARERDCFTDMLYFADPGQGPLQAQAES